ncbi:MAG: hypothetical protein R6W78_14535, partial [Bacteroidales bacterium]
MRITPQLLAKIRDYSTGKKALLTQFFSKLGKLKPKDLDLIVHRYHHEVFAEINCLECANCCKTISPILYEPDIYRLADNLKMKVSVFKDKYVVTDDDGDYVFNQ